MNPVLQSNGCTQGPYLDIYTGLTVLIALWLYASLYFSSCQPNKRGVIIILFLQMRKQAKKKDLDYSTQPGQSRSHVLSPQAELYAELPFVPHYIAKPVVFPCHHGYPYFSHLSDSSLSPFSTRSLSKVL